MSVGFPHLIATAVWSPCSRFIAVVQGKLDCGEAIEILDAVTLGQLTIFSLDKESVTRCLIFSPDGCLLTWFGEQPDRIISWDVQTGVLLSTIFPEPLGYSWGYLSATFSACGTMIGLCSPNASRPTISTYNVLSGTHIYFHSVEASKLVKVWTQGECLQFAAMQSENITTWEVGFASAQRLVEVKTLPIPDRVQSVQGAHFYPIISQLAFIIDETVFIWDMKCSKYLLDSMDLNNFTHTSFSSNGHLFACGTSNSGVYVWKESPTGYILHQKLVSNTRNTIPCISPNGELVLTFGGSVIQLWYTKDSNIPLFTISACASQGNNRSPLLEFTVENALAVVTQVKDKTVTVIDLKSGLTKLTIDTDMEVYGLGVAGETVVVVGDKQIVTWNISASNCVLNSRVNSGDSVQTTVLNDLPIAEFPPSPPISVSSNLDHIVFKGEGGSRSTGSGVHLYSISTGQCLASVYTRLDGSPHLTRDGCEVWCVDGFHADGWKIVKDGSNITVLKHQGLGKYPLGGLPWQCSSGYRVTDDGWILHFSGKRLLWLPSHWWPDQWDRVWSGQFLALLNDKLPEVLILELE